MLHSLLHNGQLLRSPAPAHRCCRAVRLAVLASPPLPRSTCHSTPIHRCSGSAMAVNTSAAAAAHDGRSTAGGVLWGHIPGFLQRVAEVNNGLHAAGELVQFCVQGQRLGWLKQDFAQRLLAFPDVFEQQAQPPQQQAAVTLHSCLDTTEARTAAVAGVLQQLRTTMPALGRGWRDEQYAVSSHFDRPPLLLLERAAAPFFGIRAYGVHVNGYVVVPDAGAGAGAAGEAGAVGGSGGSSGGAKAGGSGRKMLWVARRAATKQTWPGKLDHIVAGGQPFGLCPAANVAKECWEEAGIPAHLAAAARPVGFVSYASLSEEGLKPDVLLCYDLELPADFVPQPQDGEVDEFMLWPLERVASAIATSQDYKPNVCLVVIDFLVRHGLLAPEEPGYVQLVGSLRAGDPL